MCSVSGITVRTSAVASLGVDRGTPPRIYTPPFLFSEFQEFPFFNVVVGSPSLGIGRQIRGVMYADFHESNTKAEPKERTTLRAQRRRLLWVSKHLLRRAGGRSVPRKTGPRSRRPPPAPAILATESSLNIASL